MRAHKTVGRVKHVRQEVEAAGLAQQDKVAAVIEPPGHGEATTPPPSLAV